MGIIILKTVLVVGDVDYQSMKEAHSIAQILFGDLVSPIIPSPVNGFASFMIVPDGSKLGWQTHNEYNTKRVVFIKELLDLDHRPMAYLLHYGECEPEITPVNESTMDDLFTD